MQIIFRYAYPHTKTLRRLPESFVSGVVCGLFTDIAADVKRFPVTCLNSKVSHKSFSIALGSSEMKIET